MRWARPDLPTDAVETADFTAAGAVAATRRLLDRVNPTSTAIFVRERHPWPPARLSVLRERGRSVPGDVAVVGFDDSPAAISSAIPRATVHQPSEQMGFEMADLLLRHLAGDP